MTPVVDAPVLTEKRSWLAGEIAEPARTRSIGTACTVAVLVMYALANALPYSLYVWMPPGIAVATAVALSARATFAVHAGLLTLLQCLVFRIPVVGQIWPLNNLSALIAYALLVAAIRPLRETSGWLRRGAVDRTTRVGIAAFSVASAVALVVWRYTSHADMARFRPFVPSFVLTLPTWALVVVLPIGIAIFAMFNAAFEEVIWRGVIMQSLESAFGRGAFVCVLQAVGFGVWHYRGFPSGVVGSGLAFIFALMMGALRMRGRGMFAPWLAHVCADTTIFVMIAAMVLGG